VAARETPTLLGWSLPIAALAAGASLAGLLDPAVYAEETTNWATQAKGQDVGNLVAAVTIVVAAWRHHRGSHVAALVWLGTLFYFVYAYLVYAMAVHFNYLFLVYVAVLGLSVWALLLTAGQLHRRGVVVASGRRLAGWTLVAVGVLFALLWLGELVPALLAGEVPQSVEEAGLWVNPIHVIDLAVVLPGFVASGVLALRGDPGGVFFAGPWLVFSVLMGGSIVAAMVLMTVEGSAGTVPPMVMVSVVVLASLVAAYRLLRGVAGRAR
jgi:hypothetical protein